MNSILNFMNHNRWFLYANAILLFVLLNVAAARSALRLDLSRDGVNSLTESSYRVLSNLDSPVLVEAYITTDVPGEIISLLDPIRYQLEAIDRVGGPNVMLRIVNPDSEETRQEAERRGVQGIPIEEARVDEYSQRLGYFGIYVRMGEKDTVIDLVQEGGIIQDFEYRFLREIKKMMRTNSKSGIGYANVEGATNTLRWRSVQDQNKDNLYGFRAYVERDLGMMEDLDLSVPVPADVDTLLMAGMPELNELQRYNFDQFLLRGGNVIVMAKAFDFDMAPVNPMYAKLGLSSSSGGFATVPRDKLNSMNDWLGKYGLSVNGEILFEPRLAAASVDIQGQYLVPTPNPAWAVYTRNEGNIVGAIPALRDIHQVVFPWFSGLDVRNAAQEGVNFQTLVHTSGGAVKRDTSTLGLRDVQDVGAVPGDERVPEQLPVAVLGTGKFKSAFQKDNLPGGVDPSLFLSEQTPGTEAHLALIGSPYLVADMLFQNDVNRQIFLVNQAFLINLLESVSGDNDLLEARSRVKTLSGLGKTDPGFETIFTYFHILFIPVLTAAYGLYRLTGRNRKRGAVQNAQEVG